MLSPLEFDVDLLKKGQFKQFRETVLHRLKAVCEQLSKAMETDMEMKINQTSAGTIAGCLMKALCCNICPTCRCALPRAEGSRIDAQRACAGA